VWATDVCMLYAPCTSTTRWDSCTPATTRHRRRALCPTQHGGALVQTHASQRLVPAGRGALKRGRGATRRTWWRSNCCPSLGDAKRTADSATVYLHAQSRLPDGSKWPRLGQSPRWREATDRSKVAFGRALKGVIARLVEQGPLQWQALLPVASFLSGFDPVPRHLRRCACAREQQRE
jgi:hypothetical protein